ncbi:MAG: response regulator transcription factor [Saprospiraceae bacterium]|nr:response regulator transcription factor [Saprospiraceae bacterium]
MSQKLYKAVIIDDENKSRNIIKSLIQEYGEDKVHIIGEADSVQNGKKLLEDTTPDLVFLDINLGDGSGFDLLDPQSSDRFKIIFITAYDQFAIRAFECSAVDYLLKPLNPERFSQTLDKIFKSEISKEYATQIEELVHINQTGMIRKLTLKTEQGMEIVPVQSIIRLEADGSYTTIYLETGEKIVSSKSMGDLEEILPQNQFFRCHKSHIIQIDKMRKFLKEEGGLIVMSNGDKVSLSRRNKDAFMEIITGTQ